MDTAHTARAAALYRAIKEFADATDHNLTLRQTLVLLFVASKGPVSQSDLVDRMDLGKGTASKIITVLGGVSDGIRYNPEGLGLIVSDSTVGDRRSKQLTLTKEGETLLKRVLAKVGA